MLDRVGRCRLLIELIDLRTRLRNYDACFQPRDANERMVHMFSQVVIKLAQRHPHICPSQKLKTRRQDAGDGVALVIECNGVSDYVKISAEPPFPQRVA